MFELCILYLHHQDDSLTRIHAELLQKHNHGAAFVPLTFRDGMQNAFRFPFDLHRTSHGEWGSADLLVYDWFKSKHKITASRYVILEYDTLATMPLKEFYQHVWDESAAGAQPLIKERDADWIWFRDLDESTPLPLGGFVPLCGILLSHDALSKMVNLAHLPPLAFLNSECRIATLARLAGCQLAKIRHDAETFISWTNVTPDGPGIWHSIKDERWSRTYR